VIQRFEGHSDVKEKKEIFIIGGGEIYKQFFPLTNRMYLTVVDTVVDDGDAYFPVISWDNEGSVGNNGWRQISRIDHISDDKHVYAYSFIELEKHL